MSALPETIAAERIAAAISPHLSPAWLTEKCIRDLALKAVAHRDFIRGIFDELDRDPKRIGDRGEVLKQQQTAQVDSVDWWLGELAYHNHAAEEAEAHLRRMGASPVDYVGPDERNADEDDARISRERAAERAVETMPKVTR